MSETATSQPKSSTLSADELHAKALEANTVTNRGRLTLIQLLRIIKGSQLHHELGFSSIVGYAEHHFGYAKTQTYESLRIAEALDDLPRCLEAFAEGRLGWSQLREITRVAGSATEDQWLEFAAGHTVVQLRAEVAEAQAKKRDTPRKDGYGLPARMKRIQFELPPSDFEKVRLFLRRVSDHAAEKLDGAALTMEQSLVLAANLFGGEGSDLEKRLSEGRPMENVLVYQTCPSCHRGGVHTQEGLVEVERDEIERIQGEAVIERLDTPAGAQKDGPTPAWLTRQIHLREGQQCANPACSYTSDHCHHILFRSEDGKTNPANLAAVCAICHSLVHQSLLKVTGTGGQDLKWEPRSDSLPARLSRNRISADKLPVFRIESPRGDSAATSLAISRDEEDAASALRNMGFRKQEARDRVEAGRRHLGEGSHPLGELVRAALASGA